MLQKNITMFTEFSDKQLEETHEQTKSGDINKNSDVQLVYKHDWIERGSRFEKFYTVFEFQWKYYRIVSMKYLKEQRNTTFEHEDDEINAVERTETVVWYD